MAQFKSARHLPLLLAKLSCQRVEERIFDAAVQIVDVDLLHAFTQAVALDLQAPDRGIMILAHRAKALVQRVGEPLEEVFGDRETIEHLAELLEQRLLADIGLRALPLRVAAAVIDVFLLLDVTDEQATAMPAMDHAGEQEVILDTAHTRRVTTIQNLLHPLP